MPEIVKILEQSKLKENSFLNHNNSKTKESTHLNIACILHSVLQILGKIVLVVIDELLKKFGFIKRVCLAVAFVGRFEQ